MDDQQGVGATTIEAQTEHGTSHTEREVLRVLWAGRGQDPLVRSEIHKRMTRAHRPTLGRVGQILAALYKDRLVDRVEHLSQGSKKAGFYALAAKGRELCRTLGFKRDERLLFPVTEKELRTCLTRERLARPPEDAVGHIIAVYGYRGGLGRTTLAAHVAQGLAKRLTGHERVLVVDLDLGAPGLDDLFAPQEPPKCRGLGGLSVDFERQAAHKRGLWLFGALSSPEYVLQPLPEVPNLVYLPSGLSPGQDVLTPSERAEALAMLRAEVRTAAATEPSATDPSGFLSELREVLLQKFVRTVIDPEVGRSLGAWIATQALADELVLCAQMADTSPATIAGLRAVLASFLAEQAVRGSGGGSTFLFRLTEPTTRDEIGRWIERHLVMEGSEPASSGSATYRAEQMPYEPRLAGPHRWENTRFFAPLIARLERPGSTVGIEIVPPELQALLTVLDPGSGDEARSIAAGVLENIPLQQLTRWVGRYVQEKDLQTTTDAKGEEMINNIVRIQSMRLRSKILQPRENSNR